MRLAMTSPNTRWRATMSTPRALATTPAVATEGVAAEGGAQGPAQTACAPANIPAPVIIVLSGPTGPTSCQAHAADLAGLGDCAVLVAGRDVLNPGEDRAFHLCKAIDRAQRAAQAAPRLAVRIGSSLGGGGGLAHDAEMN